MLILSSHYSYLLTQPEMRRALLLFHTGNLVVGGKISFFYFTDKGNLKYRWSLHSLAQQCTVRTVRAQQCAAMRSVRSYYCVKNNKQQLTERKWGLRTEKGMWHHNKGKHVNNS
jgi:hypothetical protein